METRVDDPKKRLCAAGSGGGNQQMVLCLPVQEQLNMLHCSQTQASDGRFTGPLCSFCLQLPYFKPKFYGHFLTCVVSSQGVMYVPDL